jgi:Na+/H+-translocating membrane pyrophosphatase
MREISDCIREGAEAYLRTQYGAITKIAVVTALVLMGIYMVRDSPIP